MIKTIPRETRQVSYNRFFPLYESRRLREESSLKPNPLPEYLVQLLVRWSEDRQRNKESAIYRQ